MSIASMKTQITTLMTALQTAGTLKHVSNQAFKQDTFDFDFKTPAVFIFPPEITDEVLDNRSLLRKANFELQVVLNGENTDNDDVETIAEAILDKLANDPSLDGNATAGSSVTVEVPQLSQHKNKDIITFSVIIEAKRIVTLTFA